MLKKIFFPIILYMSLIFTKVSWDFSEDELDPTNKTLSEERGYLWLETIFGFIRDTIFSLILVTCLWVFLYTWTKLIIARWNQEEFKKALVWFIYTVVWITVTSLAWAIIKFASWMEF